MKNVKIRRIIAILLFAVMISGVMPLTAPDKSYANSNAKTMKVTIGEGGLDQSNLSKVVNIPHLKEVISVTTDTGNVNHSISGDNITLNASGGTPTRTVSNSKKYSKAVANYKTSSSNSFSSTNSYSDVNGYQTGGSPADSKYVTEDGAVTTDSWAQWTWWDGSGWNCTGSGRDKKTSSISYDDGEYSGTLSQIRSYIISGSSSAPTWKGTHNEVTIMTVTYAGDYGGTVYKPDTRTYRTDYTSYYEGTVIKPAVDTRVYRYEGTVNKPDTRTYRTDYTATYSGTVTKPAVDTRVYRYEGTVNKPDTRTYRTDYTATYSGTVIKPAVDTRTWRQDYSGTAYKSGNDNYYSYEITIAYIDNSDPVLNITTPVSTTYINKDKSFTLSGTVTDIDENQTITVSATIAGVKKSTTFTSPITNKAWSLTWSGSELPEGSHDTVVSVTDTEGGLTTKAYGGRLIVDKTAPTKPSIVRDKHKLVLTPGTDKESGVDKTLYSINNAEWVEHKGDIDISKFADGDYQIASKTIDKASNESEVATLSFKITYKAEIDKIDNDLDNVIIDKDTNLNDAEKELDRIQEEIDKLPEVEDKDRLQDKLDKKRTELESEEARRIGNINKDIDNIIINEDVDLSDIPNIIEDIQKEIDKLTDGNEKDRLQDKLNDKKAEFEAEEARRQNELDKRIDNIIIDEIVDLNGIEDELNDIQIEINKLPKSSNKDRLQDKLNSKRDEYKAEEQRRIDKIDNDLDNVVIGSNLNFKELMDLDNTLKNIQKEINKLPPSIDKDRLQDKLNNKLNELNKAKEDYFNDSIGKSEDDEDIKNAQEEIENSDLDDDTKEEIINKLQNKIISLTENYVKLSEALKRDPYMKTANNLIKSIKDEGIKAEFEIRMANISSGLAKNSESSIKNAENALINAEKSKQMAQFRVAKELIERLKPSAEKDAFMERINALEEEMNVEPVEEEKANDARSLQRAENAVKTAEKMKREVYIKNAENVVNKLVDSPEKDAFLERIKALRG